MKSEAKSTVMDNRQLAEKDIWLDSWMNETSAVFQELDVKDIGGGT